jgi:hypothetical protein
LCFLCIFAAISKLEKLGGIISLQSGIFSSFV